ncbi:MAG: pseudouridine synthase [Pseudomonadales bacterium]|nr:pseudouridine synthase [Pseudomonadales bacterium]MDP7146494.1 pseudouridine synthase [Pseudomonadales bacterium]MDP7358292.1 pseudouridine synthase [Pseudomonadales bacterium]MDP7597773.1 pseudouridine synthase [Pseudomonadales bacterium]
MSRLVLFNKPFGVLCQFTSRDDSATLKRYIPIPEIYPAGRLDKDSEGLVVLTNDAELQARISHPRFRMDKVYWVQVEGTISSEARAQLRSGIELNDGISRPTKVRRLEGEPLPPRVPPIRYRKSVPTSWIEIILQEGRNRQVRRMTAATGYPTLRLVRQRIGDWRLDGLREGEYRIIE